jgi:3',5'-cyclic AMP phosphodiesterase CpdA
MRIGVVSDVHLRTADRDAVTQELETVVERFNDSFRPDAVVVLGDLVEHEATAERDRENVELLVDALADLDAPVTFLVGNHDVMNLSSDDLSALLEQDLWGHVEGANALYLDSSAPRLDGAPGEVSDEQLDFLADELRADDETLLFVHHPVHYHDIRDNYWFGETPERAFCGNKKAVNAILEDHGGVTAVFNGHLHETDHTRYRGTHHFTINAFNKERPGADVTGTYAEVTLDDELIVRIAEGDRMTTTFELPVEGGDSG